VNKQKPVDGVAACSGDSKAATGEAIDAVLAVIRRAPTAGAAVQQVGFGSFPTGQRAGRNPSTGADIQMAAARTVRFTAGKAFMAAVSAS
jgi:DNA-binding protein HU-beta